MTVAQPQPGGIQLPRHSRSHSSSQHTFAYLVRRADIDRDFEEAKALPGQLVPNNALQYQSTTTATGLQDAQRRDVSKTCNVAAYNTPC